MGSNNKKVNHHCNFAQTSSKNIQLSNDDNHLHRDHQTVTDVALKGAVEGAIMVRDITAILIAMIALVGFLNG
jgi:nucleoside permease NupC